MTAKKFKHLTFSSPYFLRILFPSPEVASLHSLGTYAKDFELYFVIWRLGKARICKFYIYILVDNLHICTRICVYKEIRIKVFIGTKN